MAKRIQKSGSVRFGQDWCNFFKQLYSDSGYICHISTQDKLYVYTTGTFINTNFQCKIIQVHFNRDFVGEK